VLREDGSPPAYYLLLHVWIDWFGDGERATHALSLVFALACIPLAYWAARSIFGVRAAWICAGLATVDPYLTYYAQETRMYTLVACLSFVAAGAYVRGVLNGRRRHLLLLAFALTLTLYTHNWGLFLVTGFGVATLVCARRRWREAAIALGSPVLLYLPWLPTLLFQSRHTGAPWAVAPSFHALPLAPGTVLSGGAALVAFAIAAGAGLVSVARRRDDSARVPVLALAVTVAVTVLCAWSVSQLAPAWATRYFAVVFGPLLLLGATGFARAGKLGLVALAAVVVLWTNYSVREKSNVRELARAVTTYVRPGDLVLSTHPEQVPTLRYYLGPRLRFATTLGPVADARVMDWRDALHRLNAATPRRELEPLLARIRPGRRLVLVAPVFRADGGWRSRWTRRVYLTSRLWTDAVARDPRFRPVTVVRPDKLPGGRTYWKPLRAIVYVRTR
jgi:hypothetical protein